MQVNMSKEILRTASTECDRYFLWERNTTSMTKVRGLYAKPQNDHVNTHRTQRTLPTRNHQL